MTETPHKSGLAWAELTDDALEAVEIIRTAAIEDPCRAT